VELVCVGLRVVEAAPQGEADRSSHNGFAMTSPDFPSLFSALTGAEKPFPWQEDLFARFASGDIPSGCDIPTGLGKTSVIPIWLFARALGARVPRRMVYVVDRRAVVDQATTEALNLRAFVAANADLQVALGLTLPSAPPRALPISTLRGQHVDNRDWLGSPADPAIIVGTVDMIGSRLLFEGYGVSRKMRPFHAGFLGCDTLVVLDEAHLVPPFEGLLRTIENRSKELASQGEARRLVPEFKLLSLSATSRGGGSMFGLTKKDLSPGTETHKRLTARKRLTFKPMADDIALADVLAETAWKLTASGTAAKKIIVFSNKREVARKAHEAIEEMAKGDKRAGIPPTAIQSELLVGGRRVFERQGVANWLASHGFLGGAGKAPENPTFVFATSAGEVGVDLDADHMVSDLVTWERMIQRFGRVNRRGNGDAQVIVVLEPEPKPTKTAENALKKDPAERDEKEAKAITDYEKKRELARALAKPFDLLPSDSDGIDVSSAALRDLKLSLVPKANGEIAADVGEGERRQAIITAATSKEPLRPALTPALMEAWSMTSLPEHTGRPRIQPWLRGWEDDVERQTSVLWRCILPLPSAEEVAAASVKAHLAAFFEAAPPHVSEMLEAPTVTVLAWLKKRAEALAKPSEAESGKLHPNDLCAVILARDGELRRPPLRLANLLFWGDDKKTAKRKEDDLQYVLSDAVLVLDSRFAGLNPAGLLDDLWKEPPKTLDGPAEWLGTTDGKPAIRFRVRKVDAESESLATDPNWKARFTCPFERSAEGEAQTFLIVEKWRGTIESADDATAPTEQGLDEHQSLTEQKATQTAQRLSLPDEYAKMLAVAARLHDEGKRHEQWQNAFNAPTGGRPYAKTKGPINQAILGGFRHEFASLVATADDAGFNELDEDMQDLALHLIAAHHGFGRPLITTRGYPDSPPSMLDARARAVAERFVRLQRQWGPWGLAWWESLLRAADQQASSEIGSATQQTSTTHDNG
jgi:CRISPR-associated endonuclease/helicase Cas3